MDFDELASLNVRDLREVVARMADTANKRLSRLSGQTTPATMQAERGGGRFSTRGKSLNQLRTEYTRARAFLNAQTSTITGVREWKSNVNKALEESGIRLNEDEETQFWDIYKRIYHNHSVVDEKMYKYEVWRSVIQKMKKGTSADEIVKKIGVTLNDIYNAEQKKRSSGVSDFFGTK